MNRQAGRSLGPGEKPQIKLRYPYMRDEDCATWRLFLRSGKVEFEEVWYGVHVGTYRKLLAGSPASMPSIGVRVSIKRVDVVGRRGGTLYVIKVKAQVNPAVIRQVVTLRKMFVMEFRITGPVWPLIVAKKCDDSLFDIARIMKVKIIATNPTRLKKAGVVCR